MKKWIFLAGIMAVQNTQAQNIGVGTNTPLAKLHVYTGASGATPFVFSPLAVESNGHTYINILSPAANETAVLFGKPGNSASGGIMYNNETTPNGFQFRNNGNITQMVLDNAGNVGIGNANPGYKLDVSGRMRLRHSPDGTAGLWLNNSANTAVQSFFGMEDDNYVGLYGSTGWNFGMNINNGDVKIMSRLGIGTTTPNAPLSFPPFLGKKITLYPGVTGDVGMAVQGNLLQIYSDNPNADIAMGYDQAGVFTERLRVRANGGIAVNGNEGTAGQVLQSGGSGVPPVWTNRDKNVVSISNLVFNPLVNNDDETNVANVTVTLTQTSYVEVSGTVGLYSAGCFNCGNATVYLLLNNPPLGQRIVAANQNVISYTTMSFVAVSSFPLAPGTYTYTLKAKKIFGPTVTSSEGFIGSYGTQYNSLVARIIPN